jgi:hypothetical protein
VSTGLLCAQPCNGCEAPNKSAAVNMAAAARFAAATSSLPSLPGGCGPCANYPVHCVQGLCVNCAGPPGCSFDGGT